MTPDEHKTVPDRITRYLTSGGLFNPELVCHEDVRGLLIDCRTALAASEANLATAKNDALEEAAQRLEAYRDYTAAEVVRSLKEKT